MVKRIVKPMTRLSKEQIEEKMNFIKNYKISSNASTASAVDANANVSQKTVSTLGTELMKDFNIQINREAMYESITKYFGEEDAQKYIASIEEHSLYKNDETCQTPGTPYCVSITLYPFFEHGMKTMGGESGAPKHLESFCGSLINLVFAVSSQFSGAVAVVEFLLYFHYFAVKDYGKDYLKTHPDVVESKLQSVVYTLNMPAAARGYQAVFLNLSVFDRYFYESMFGHFYFPDGTHYGYDEFNELQKFFLEWLLKERKKSLLTFPVLTEASLDENGEPKDKEWAELIADLRSRGLSMFSYNDTNVAALASCCLEGTERVVMEYKGKRFCLPISELVEEITDMKRLIFDNKREAVFQTESGEVRFPLTAFQIISDETSAVVRSTAKILAMNPETGETEFVHLEGAMKKSYYGKMITFMVSGKEVCVTPDHVFLVLDEQTQETVELPAMEIAKDIQRYRIPVDTSLESA